MKTSEAYIIPGLKTLDELVCQAFGITIEQLKAKDRKREGADARKFVMWYRKNNSNLSLEKIGAMYTGRDHATVFAAAKKFEELIETDKIFRQKCERALELIEKQINMQNL